MEPGTGSPIVAMVFYVLVVLLFTVIGLLLLRTALLLSLLWIYPLAKVFSFVPWVRRWIERKNEDLRSV
jgi:hypothetical protein